MFAVCGKVGEKLKDILIPDERLMFRLCLMVAFVVAWGLLGAHYAGWIPGLD